MAVLRSKLSVARSQSIKPLTSVDCSVCVNYADKAIICELCFPFFTSRRYYAASTMLQIFCPLAIVRPTYLVRDTSSSFPSIIEKLTLVYVTITVDFYSMSVSLVLTPLTIVVCNLIIGHSFPRHLSFTMVFVFLELADIVISITSSVRPLAVSQTFEPFAIVSVTRREIHHSPA